MDTKDHLTAASDGIAQLLTGQAAGRRLSATARDRVADRALGSVQALYDVAAAAIARAEVFERAHAEAVAGQRVSDARIAALEAALAQYADTGNWQRTPARDDNACLWLLAGDGYDLAAGALTKRPA